VIRAAILWLAVSARMAAADGLPALHDVTGVAGNDVLNIRAAPDATAPVLGSIAPDATGVEVVGLSPDGRWAVVNTGEGRGYAALRYLARQAAPEWFSLQVPLTCSGTEPFWSFAYDPAQPVAVFSTPEGQAPFELTTRWPGTPYQRTAALALGDRRFATLQAAACSDGMSDRAYGIAASFFMIGSTGPAILSGCCSLQP